MQAMNTNFNSTNDHKMKKFFILYFFPFFFHFTEKLLEVKAEIIISLNVYNCCFPRKCKKKIVENVVKRTASFKVFTSLMY